MPLYKNVSQVLEALDSRDVRFTAITLPEQFSLWFTAKQRLVEANPDLAGLLEPAEHTLGMLVTAQGQPKGFMVILPPSRYYTTEGS